MKKATFIKPEDLENLEYDENGNIVIPEGFTILINDNREDIARIEAEIARIEAQVEPTDEELIKWAKIEHPYFKGLEILEHYKTELIRYGNH